MALSGRTPLGRQVSREPGRLGKEGLLPTSTGHTATDKGLLQGGSALADVLGKAAGTDYEVDGQAVSGPGEGAPVVQHLDLRGE
jgi:hypothetical protein